MSVESNACFCYKPDRDFQELLTFSLNGAAWTLFVMQTLGHNPGTQRTSDVLSSMFKNPEMKRDYHSDFVCLRCGQRFEAKSKSKDDGFLVGPDLLERYAQDHAIIVFSYPSRVATVKAVDLWKHRAAADYKVNRWKEPYLDFKNVGGIPLVFEHQKTVCSRGASP